MTEAAIKSKEIIVAIMAFAIGMIVDFTGVVSPHTRADICCWRSGNGNHQSILDRRQDHKCSAKKYVARGHGRTI